MGAGVYVPGVGAPRVQRKHRQGGKVRERQEEMVVGVVAAAEAAEVGAEAAEVGAEAEAEAEDSYICPLGGTPGVCSRGDLGIGMWSAACVMPP
jgi:hypothetical protein